MKIREAYIFVPLDGRETVAARIQHHRETNVDRYFLAYGKSYLAHPNAYSLDPREMPLQSEVMVFERLPLAIQDNGPDDFGRALAG